MAENFTKHFVDLSGRGFGSNRSPEFSLNHREGSLNIRPLMIVEHERIPIEVVVMPHVAPQTIKLMMMVSYTSGVRLEGNVSRATLSLDGMEITPVRVSFISRNLVDVECLSRLAYQCWKLNIISRLIGCSLNAGDYMSLYPTNQVCLNPSLFRAFLAVFVVEPSGIGCGGEARRINCKVSLNRSEWAGTLLNEGFQYGSQVGILQISESACERWRFFNQFLCFGVSYGGHEASARHCSIGLIDHAENHISQWESRSPESLWWLLYAVAKVTEQGDKAFLLVSLSVIISSPFLSAGHFNRFSLNGSAVWFSLTFHNKLNSVYVLTWLLSLLKVRTSAKWASVVKIDDIAAITRLGGHFPSQFVLFNLACRCYYQSSFFSSIHLNYLRNSIYIYNSIHCKPLSIPITEIFFVFPIDNSLRCMVVYKIMNEEVQSKIAILEQKGWTLVNIGRALGLKAVTIESWKAGSRSPANLQLVLDKLDELIKQKRIPPKKVYQQ